MRLLISPLHSRPVAPTLRDSLPDDVIFTIYGKWRKYLLFPIEGTRTTVGLYPPPPLSTQTLRQWVCEYVCVGMYACECACVHAHVSTACTLHYRMTECVEAQVAFKCHLFHILRFMCNFYSNVQSTTTFFIVKYVKHTSTQEPMHSFENEAQDLSRHMKVTVAVRTKTDPDVVYRAAAASRCT